MKVASSLDARHHSDPRSPPHDGQFARTRSAQATRGAGSATRLSTEGNPLDPENLGVRPTSHPGPDLLRAQRGDRSIGAGAGQGGQDGRRGNSYQRPRGGAGPASPESLRTRALRLGLSASFLRFGQTGPTRISVKRRLSAGSPGPTIHANSLPSGGCMLRYVLAFLSLFLVGGAACTAAVGAGAPASVQVAFVICLGLFIGALADGVAAHRSRLRK